MCFFLSSLLSQTETKKPSLVLMPFKSQPVLPLAVLPHADVISPLPMSPHNL